MSGKKHKILRKQTAMYNKLMAQYKHEQAKIQFRRTPLFLAIRRAIREHQPVGALR